MTARSYSCAAGGAKKLQYSTFGAACAEVEVNLLTGERRVLRADVLHDAGCSISPAVDMGQVRAHAGTLHAWHRSGGGAAQPPQSSSVLYALHAA
jgi:xanthine dehydrogenase molybdopterin-binding subunit B